MIGFPAPRGRSNSISGAGVTPIVVLALVGQACTTTHVIGRFEAPETQAQLGTLMAESTVTAHVGEPPPSNLEWGYFPVVERAPAGLKIEFTQGEPRLVASSYVRSFAVRRRGRGALDGMAMGSAGGAALGFLIGIAVHNEGDCVSTGPCGTRYNPPFIIFSTVLLGLVGALIGAGPGALVGHTDAYVLTR